MTVALSGCTSPVSDEVAIQIDLNAETISAGEPVWIRFRLLNGTEEAVVVGVHDGELKDLSVTVSDTAGRRVGPPADYRVPTCGLWYPEAVEPGETFERGVLLNRRSRLDEPGEYVVRVRYPSPLPPTTNERLRRRAEFSLKLRVTPDDKGLLTTVAEELATAACRDGAEPTASRLAARALASMDDPVALPFLERLLDCGDFLVRVEGVAGLRRQGSARAVEVLIAAAQAPDMDLAGIAGPALESIVLEPRSVELPPALVARARAAVGKSGSAKTGVLRPAYPH